ncbi:MAG: M23 family metallopeptidase [Bacteroidales bacterium]|nr:M23 family metallopeptidase [Bacteroidales bacterium]MDY0313587.1 M23 family metallopeptidase [Bacteroidales bacterium]
MNKKKNKISNWLRKKFQLVVYHGNTYDTVNKYKFNRLGFLVFLFGIFIVLFTILSLFVIYTPIKQMIPGYPDKETKELIYKNAIKTDSLIYELEMKDQYLKMIQDIVFNDIPIDEDFVVPIQNLTEQQVIDFNDPTKPRIKIEDDTDYYLPKGEEMPNFIEPLKGIIVSKYLPSQKHFGVDIAAVSDELIKATYRGTVISSDYTIENGYTIIIQHKTNIISVYKHAQSSLVKAGDKVKTGQIIANYGNSGENTSGPHLHFELWKNGKSINPEDYIQF